MAGKKKYFDLRYLFMRGLIQRERWQRTRHYLKSAAECTSRAVVSLELAENPVKSVSQAKQLEGIGGETQQRLKDILNNKEKSSDRPTDGKFVSSAGALLVALLDLTEQVERSGTGDLALISEDVLKCEARPLCEELFVEESGFCQAWWRVEVLIKRGLVKRRQLNKEDVYQLMVLGREVAHRLRADRDALIEKSNPVKSPCSSKLKSKSTTKEAPSTSASSGVPTPENYLYTNDMGLDGIILEVDTQEMGGDRVGLGQHCERLERCGIRYRTCRLPSGDYRWVWRCEGTERTIPLLVERKRADDIAHSLKDGRFWRQVTKMTEWKEAFTKNDIHARLVYIIEGDPADYVVRCGDGCQGVGRCGNPTLTQVKLALKDLEEHPELEIRKTNCVESTVQYLAVVTEEIGKRANKGDYDMLIVSEMMEDNEKYQKPPEVMELEDTPIEEQTEDIKTEKLVKQDSHVKIVKCEDLETENDSQENNTSWEDLPNMNDSEELPPLDHSPSKIKAKSGRSLRCKTNVRKRNISGSNDHLIPGGGIKASKTITTKSRHGLEVDVKNEADDILDIDSELSVFSTFSEHSNLKRTHSDVIPDEPKKRLTSPLKKIKFNCSAGFVETRTEPSQVSPRHGKVYLMKKCRNSQVSRNNLTKKLDECVTKQVSSLSRATDASQRDKHLVELSPRRGDLNSSPEPGCSGAESKLQQSNTVVADTSKQDVSDMQVEDAEPKLKINFPFNSGKSTVNSTSKESSSFLRSYQNTDCATFTHYTSNPSHGNSNQSVNEKHCPSSISLESRFCDFKQSYNSVGRDSEYLVRSKQNDCDSDDSLPDVGLSEKVLQDLPSEPVPSTSGTHLMKSEFPPKDENSPEVLFQDEVQSLYPSKQKQRKRSPRKKIPLPNSDEDVTVMDLDTDYVPESGRHGRKRNASKTGKQGRKGKSLDESLVAQVADILPHYGQDQIRAALIKCKMNVEHTVSELLDSVSQGNDDVVDLT